MRTTNHKMRTSLLAICTIGIILSGCEYTGHDDIDQSHKLKAGRTAYIYTERNLQHFTDILAYTRMFREYIRQTTIDGRDSVNALYFPNVKVVRSKDPMHNTDIYNLTVRNQRGAVDYNISIFDPKSPAWKVQASTGSAYETLFINLVINGVYTHEWTIAESSCIPKALYYTQDGKPAAEERPGAVEDPYNPYQFAFQVKNGPITVQWAHHGLYPVFEFTGSGTLESYTTPRLTMAYRITQPLEVLTFPGYDTISRDFAYVTAFTAYRTGAMQLTANDTIDNTVEQYTISLLEQYLRVATETTKDQYYRN